MATAQIANILPIQTLVFLWVSKYPKLTLTAKLMFFDKQLKSFPNGLDSGSRDADYGVASGQPDAAGRLTPERLGFDDLTELPVVRAVVPAICINPHHSTARLAPELCPRTRDEPPLPEPRPWRTEKRHSRSLPARAAHRRGCRHSRPPTGRRE